jgi:hypothetical protein
LNQYTKTIVVFLLLLSINVVFASNKYSVEFFASNNTSILDLQTAYERLNGNEQSELQNSMIEIMQENHIEQGKFEDILGTYQMSNDKKITADNTEHFITSPLQYLSNDMFFSLAKELAIKLNQDSVAVFIPDDANLGDITVNFSSHQPYIDELVNKIQNMLPEQYNKAFSLHLIKKSGNFADTTVAEVEWLGSTMNIDVIKRAFPSEKISFRYGKVYLVYKDGRIEQL